MSSPRSRLLFALVSLIVTVLICLGLLLGQLFKDFYLEAMNKRVEKEAEMIALLLERQNIDVVRSQMTDMSETLASRITVLDNQERTLLDTGRLANISDRAHEQIVRDILHSKKKKSSFYY